jgi:hypothetical protein
LWVISMSSSSCHFNLLHTINVHHPLMYVEWFTPLGRPETFTGMHIVSRSTRFYRQNAAIILADRIIRNCHLVGKCGLIINHDWTTDNVLDIASHFYINPYIHLDSFTAFKCYCNDGLRPFAAFFFLNIVIILRCKIIVLVADRCRDGL